MSSELDVVALAMACTSEPDVVVMARIAGPFGIKGWVKLQTFTDAPDSLDAYASWLIRDSKLPASAPWREVVLEDFAVNVKGVVAKLEGFDDRTSVEGFVKFDVAIPRADLVEADEGEHFWIDLIGATVSNPAGDALGVVDTLMETGANDVLVVQHAGGQRLIPFVDAVIVKVDRTLKQIVVNWEADW